MELELAGTKPAPQEHPGRERHDPECHRLLPIHAGKLAGEPSKAIAREADTHRLRRSGAATGADRNQVAVDPARG